MDRRDMLHIVFLASSLFALSFLLFSNTVTSVTLSLGAGEPLVAKVPRMFSVSHVLFIIAITAVATASFIRLADSIRASERVEGKQDIALRALHGDERRLYQLVMQRGEWVQKDLVYESQMPKSKVTRLLDRLEQKGLVEKRPFGNTNKVRVA